MAMEKNFDAATAEQQIYAAWEAAGAFKAGANAKEGMDSFTIMIPPPNVTGVLHMGHAFNNTLQDILIRWKRMQGYDTLWQPGQDHAGIATQMVVERQLAEAGNEGRKELGREKFLEKVWEWKEQSGGTIMEQTKRLGASCDWSRNRFTMDEGFHDAVLKVFVDMYNKGLIYKGTRLVNWDPKFETAISDLEVESTEVDGQMWHFKYPLAGGATYEYVERDEDGNETLRETRNYIAIATTRPETMLGDGAVAVHPDDERYKPLIGKLCEIPVGPKAHRRLIPIITDEYPDMSFGSGAVKITGAHDANDYGVATRNNIPLYRLMDTKAAMRDDGTDYIAAATRAKAISEGASFESAEIDALNLVPDAYRGMDRYVCRKQVIKDIDAEGLMLMVEDKKIMQPFGDRSKVVIEPMLTQQWYVDTAKIVKPALDAVRSGDIKIIPESGEKTYYHWLENIEPWCISRQLWWGHQIPVWYGPEVVKTDSGVTYKFSSLLPFCADSEEAVLEKVRKHYNREPIVVETGDLAREQVDKLNIFSNKAAGDIVAHRAQHENLPVPIYRDPDVLDTWFSSGLWPIGTLGWPADTAEMEKYFPTSVLVTGFDILFFWVARMIMMQLAVVDKIPFDTVYLHALVRDEHGKKMSKSTGNVIDPLEMIDEFGADAVRFTLSAMGRDLKLSKERFIGYRNFGTKLWNATRFAEMNECKPGGFDPASAEQTVNKWIIGETVRALHATDKALEAYRFSDAAMGLYAHVWGKLCDWYVEFAKPLFQSDDEAVKAETRATMAWAIDQSLTMLHPIMPYITEQLWGDIAARENMLVHQDWPELPESLIDDAANREMNWVISLIENIRSVRAEMRVPAGAKIPMVQLELDDAGKAALARNEVLVKRLARVEEIILAEEAPKGAVTVAVEGGTFCLPLADIIDVDAEKARLEKAMLKLSKEIGGLKGKLGNAKFLERAPEAVVAENRKNLARVEEEADKIQEAIKRLDALA